MSVRRIILVIFFRPVEDSFDEHPHERMPPADIHQILEPVKSNCLNTTVSEIPRNIPVAWPAWRPSSRPVRIHRLQNGVCNRF